jgi:hypothetical protein
MNESGRLDDPGAHQSGRTPIIDLRQSSFVPLSGNMLQDRVASHAILLHLEYNPIIELGGRLLVTRSGPAGQTLQGRIYVQFGSPVLFTRTIVLLYCFLAQLSSLWVRITHWQV